MRKVFCARQTISYLLSFQGYLSIPKSVRLLQRHHKSSGPETPLVFRNRTAASSSADSVLGRSDELATRRLGQESLRSDEKEEYDPSADLPFWLQDFTDNLVPTEVHVPAHVSQDLDSEHSSRKWTENQGSTVFSLTSRKTEIATSASGPKWQNPLAGDALTKQYLEQKSLVTWWRLITKSWMKRVNPETLTGTLSWYKILPLNGFNLIRAKQLLRKRKRVQGSFSSRRKSQKSFTLTIRWNLGEHVRFFHGITALQLLIDPKQMVLLKEPYDEWKKERQQYCHNQDWIKGRCQILWNDNVICEMSKTSWLTEKHRTKNDSENHSKGQ